MTVIEILSLSSCKVACAILMGMSNHSPNLVINTVKIVTARASTIIWELASYGCLIWSCNQLQSIQLIDFSSYSISYFEIAVLVEHLNGLSAASFPRLVSYSKTISD